MYFIEGNAKKKQKKNKASLVPDENQDSSHDSLNKTLANDFQSSSMFTK